MQSKENIYNVTRKILILVCKHSDHIKKLNDRFIVFLKNIFDLVYELLCLCDDSKIEIFRKLVLDKLIADVIKTFNIPQIYNSEWKVISQNFNKSLFKCLTLMQS